MDTEVSMRLQGSCVCEGVSQCLDLGFQVALGSHNGLWGSQGSWTLRAQGGPRGLNAALGSHSVWVWGLGVALGSHGASWGLRMVLGISGQLDAEGSMRLYGSQGSPRGVTVSGSEVSGGPGVLQWP